VTAVTRSVQRCRAGAVAGSERSQRAHALARSPGNVGARKKAVQILYEKRNSCYIFLSGGIGPSRSCSRPAQLEEKDSKLDLRRLRTTFDAS
jgi:hypothetical protein